MPFETVTILTLSIFMVVREVLHFLQVSKLQDLLKSVDITEYYNAKGKTTAESPSQNKVMSEPNQIAIEQDGFDIRKVSSVIIDGEEKPIAIYD